MWKLISYSEVKLPLKPYISNYVIGIVENEDKKRAIVQIDKENIEDISIGMSGDLKNVDGPSGTIQVFAPKLKREAKKVNKVALITGASRGIGKAIAIELARNDIDVIVNSEKSVTEGNETANEIKKLGRRSIYIQADVSNPDEVKKMIQEIIKSFGRIDILVNNAGITLDKRLENMTPDQWNKVISINLTGVYNCTSSVLSYMRKQNGGRIINISSVIGETGNIGQANYAASKGGIISFTKALAKECSVDNVLVNAIAPGFIKTKMLETIPKDTLQKIISDIPLGRLGEPEEVAKLVNFLVSDDSKYITGQVLNINGGLYM